MAGGTPTPFPVGTDGVVVSGTHPDEHKAVTLVFFTEGQALVRLEFQSAIGDATTDQFVTNVGKMQQIALRVGLGRPRVERSVSAIGASPARYRRARSW